MYDHCKNFLFLFCRVIEIEVRVEAFISTVHYKWACKVFSEVLSDDKSQWIVKLNKIAVLSLVAICTSSPTFV